MRFLLIILMFLSCCSQKSTSVTPTTSNLEITNIEIPTIPPLTPTSTHTPTPKPTQTTHLDTATTTPTSSPHTPEKTPTFISPTAPPEIDFHTTSGIHLSLHICTETEHFVLYCTEFDARVTTVIVTFLENEFGRIVSHLKHEPTTKIEVEIYPNLDSFHAAVDHKNGSEWFVGKANEGKMQFVTPLNPGPKHSYDTVLSVAVHEFTHLLVDEMTANELPAWLDEGIATYESGQRQPQFVAAQLNNNVPNISALNFNSVEDANTVYAFSYTIIEFIVDEFGYDAVIQLVVNGGNIEEITNLSEQQFETEWHKFLINEYSPFLEQ